MLLRSLRVLNIANHAIWGCPRRLIQTSATCVFASQFLGVAFYCRCFSAFTFGSRFFIELTTTNFCQNTRFFAGTLEATQSYVERVVFAYFNYRHVPLTSIKSVCLLVCTSTFQNGAEFYSNLRRVVKHNGKLKLRLPTHLFQKVRS